MTAVLDAYPDWQIPARVITTIPSADRQKATVLVRIGFLELDPRILPDMGVKVTFLRDDEDGAGRAAGDARARRPPSRPTGQQSYVFVVITIASTAGDHHRRADGDRVEVIAGLNRRRSRRRVAASGTFGRCARRLTVTLRVKARTLRPHMNDTCSRPGRPQTLHRRQRAHRRPERRQPGDPEGRFSRADGTVGIRQDDAPQPDRRARHAHGGAVDVNGVRVSSLSGSQLSKWRARNIGFVFQLYNLLPVLTAEKNVELPLLLTNLSKVEREEARRHCAENRRPGRTGEPLPTAAVRRTGTARRHRPRDRDRSDAAAVRRADRRPRPQGGRRDPRPCCSRSTAITARRSSW